MNKSTPSPLRESKASKIKLSILQTTLDLIGNNSFDKVHVNQICEIVDISKVTFFKYFSQKEDILLYYLRVWCFHRCVELSVEHKQGIDGIRFLFDMVCQSYERTPGIFLGLISYLSRHDMPIRPFPLKGIERQMLYPEVENISEIDTLSLDQLFENFLLEAIFIKEITRTGDTKQMVQLLDSVLYGTIMTAHIRQLEHPSILFRNNLDTMLESLRSGEMSFA
jgi:AcrR family transcriptional regulator